MESLNNLRGLFRIPSEEKVCVLCAFSICKSVLEALEDADQQMDCPTPPSLFCLPETITDINAEHTAPAKYDHSIDLRREQGECPHAH